MKAAAILSLTTLLTGAYAHSWVECVKTVVPNKEELKANPPSQFSWGSEEKCEGFPRAVKYRKNGAMIVDPGDNGWNEETLYLTWEKDKNVASDGRYYACPERQRTPEKTWKGPNGEDVEPPVATARPGESLMMRHWGNGHSTWNPTYANPKMRDPGVVQVFHKDEWDGGAEMWLDDLNESSWVKGAQGNFSGDAVTLYTQEPRPGPPTDQKLMLEFANYFTWKVPDSMPEGRHVFVWVWRFKQKDQPPSHMDDSNSYWTDLDIEYTSCFDVVVSNSGSSSSDNTSAPPPPPSDSESNTPSPAAEESSQPPSSQAQDVVSDPLCKLKCKVAGAFEMCDPTVDPNCPQCIVRDSPNNDCYQDCAFPNMVKCPRGHLETGSKKAKRTPMSVHSHKRGILAGRHD